MCTSFLMKKPLTLLFLFSILTDFVSQQVDNSLEKTNQLLTINSKLQQQLKVLLTNKQTTIKN